MRSCRLFAVLSLVLLTAIVGCGVEGGGPKGTTGTKGSALSGEVAIEGSSTVEPISLKAKELFNESNPDVNVAVSGNGSSNGFKALGAKECDVCDASRPIKKKEVDTCKANDVEFYELPVAYDGLSICVNPSYDFVKELTVDQLKKIFREDMAAKTWDEVDASWPKETIKVYSPGIASGTHDYFVEVIGKKDKKGHRADANTILSEDDKQLVKGVSGDKFSIGFFGYSYYDANKDELKVVPIVNKAGKAVTPSMETIASGEYEPFSRPLFIYINKESYLRAEVQEFVDFYLENGAELAASAGYVKLPASIYTQGQENLAKEVTGTHYVTEEGEKRAGGVEDVFKAENLMK